jgi:hypothetical protein
MQLIFSCLNDTENFQSILLTFWVTMYFDPSSRYLSLHVTRHFCGHTFRVHNGTRHPARSAQTTVPLQGVGRTHGRNQRSPVVQTKHHRPGERSSDLYRRHTRELEDLLQSFRREYSLPLQPSMDLGLLYDKCPFFFNICLSLLRSV